MTDINPAGTVWLAKLAGAIAGSAISLAYLFPCSRREAALRFMTGVTGGVVFGTTAGVAVAERLAIADVLSEFETVLMGAALASVSIWWAMGLAIRFADRGGSPKGKNGTRKPDDPS
ncbi:DUF6107 family protein [Oceaniradius stylonematis]|jgi:hypothetical protein|uniref:DUF6107 family protein n=1 Tax=Oceaniradius stylonematis TaxID=2184161 RepID=UPI0035D0A2A6